jgi:HAD superfamily hydrolase (TIGR01490 family)
LIYGIIFKKLNSYGFSLKEARVHSKIHCVKKAAIFDIDGTIIKNISSERVFFCYLIEKKIITSKDILRFANVFFNKFLSLKGLYIRKNKYYLKDREYKGIVSNVHECFHERISPYISAAAIKEMNKLKESGHVIILLSGTLSPFVECFKKYCNADVGIGTNLAIDDEGKITGEIDGIHSYSRGKATIMNCIAAEYNLDLSSCYAYANQYLDVKFMRMVGYPVAVNASPMLRLYARINRWKIVEF